MRLLLVTQTIVILILLDLGPTDGSRWSRLLELLKSKDAGNYSWPYSLKSECTPMDTKDTTYKPTTDFYIHRVPACGLNKFATEKTVQTKIDALKRTLDESPAASDDWLRRALRLVGDIDKLNNDDIDTNEEDIRIVGGEQSQSGKFPWLVAVGTKAHGPKCGGSLIGDQWVLTAAHCFDDKEYACTYNVRLGTVDWKKDEEGTHVDRSVSAIYRHPDYDRETSQNDVALLKLSEKVSLDRNSNINAICLPTSGRSVALDTVCLAAGWGYTVEAQNTGMQDEAREVPLPIIAYGSPGEVDGKCGKYPVNTFFPGMVCAGYKRGKMDTCQGDSGGPLMYYQNGFWTQLGLTSFGTGCARADFPGVYTDVGQFLSWLAFTMNKNP